MKVFLIILGILIVIGTNAYLMIKEDKNGSTKGNNIQSKEQDVSNNDKTSTRS